MQLLRDKLILSLLHSLLFISLTTWKINIFPWYRATDPDVKKRKSEDIEDKQTLNAGIELKTISDGIDTIFKQVSSQTTVRISGLQTEAVKNSFTCSICKTNFPFLYTLFVMLNFLFLIRETLNDCIFKFWVLALWTCKDVVCFPTRQLSTRDERRWM